MPIDDDFAEEAEQPYNAADPKAVNNMRKKAARLHKKRVDFVRAMMGRNEGRMWIYDILVMGHLSEPTHTPNDPYSTAFKEGERNIANKILSDINEAAPEQYMVMLTEGKDEK